MVNEPPEPDPDLKRKIADEGNGIFYWMVEGLCELLPRKKFPLGSETSQDIRARFKVENNPIKSFVQERCELNKDRSIVPTFEKLPVNTASSATGGSSASTPAPPWPRSSGTSSARRSPYARRSPASEPRARSA
jgi:hypothetical protein